MNHQHVSSLENMLSDVTCFNVSDTLSRHGFASDQEEAEIRLWAMSDAPGSFCSPKPTQGDEDEDEDEEWEDEEDDDYEEDDEDEDDWDEDDYDDDYEEDDEDEDDWDEDEDEDEDD